MKRGDIDMTHSDCCPALAPTVLGQPEMAKKQPK
jgi:hypothetical protein